MDEASEIDRLRDHWHALRSAVDAVDKSVAVLQERQKSHSAQLDRIEAAVTPLPAKVAVLEAGAAAAATSGARWGAGVGALISALVAGLAAVFGGGK